MPNRPMELYKTDKKLLIRLSRGECEAYESLFDRYYDKVRHGDETAPVSPNSDEQIPYKNTDPKQALAYGEYPLALPDKRVDKA